MKQDQEILKQWAESAPYWEKHRATITQMFAPVTQALIEDANITIGSMVLDVATGPGEPALTIAQVVGNGGKVVGTDLVVGMVEAARREANRRNLENANFEVASTEQLSFLPNSFDAVISRFGVMFFPSPVDCLREMLRVLKPGKRIAMAVWHFADKNPFHYTVSQVVERYVDSPPLAPDSPDAFRFAEPGKLLAILMKAGATETSERILRFSIDARASVEDFWTLRSGMSEKLRTKLAKLSESQIAKLKHEVIEAIGAYSSERGISFPGEALIVRGTKPLNIT